MSSVRIIQFVSICFVCCATLMFILFVSMGQSNRTKNGFTRHIPNGKTTIHKAISLTDNEFYLAGHTAEQVYLGNIKKPFYLFVIHPDSPHIRSLRLTFPEKVRYTWQSARISVDSPYIYVDDGITPKFFIGDLHRLMMDTFMNKSSYFTAAANISPGSFAVRAVNAANRENMLVKVQADSPYVTLATNILKKQVDGIFCTDGELKYDKVSRRLIYMYYYRNQYLLLDTNLHIIKSCRTIDTTTVAKISIANTSGQGNFTLSSPPAFVNITSCLNGDKIYIRSALAGDNEGMSVMNKSNPVDVYAVTGNYIRSLYIPKQQEESIKEMCILKNKLIALYPHSIMVYNLPQDLLLQ